MSFSEYVDKRWAKHPGYSVGEFKKMDIILKMIGSKKTVLDIGSFDGTIAERIKDKNNKIFSIDVSFSALKNAKKKIVNLVQVPIDPVYPFKDKTFDIIFLGEVLEHVLDTDMMLVELKRILKDDGYLIVTTPNVASLPRRVMLLIGISPFLEFSLDPARSVPGIGHIRYFTKSTLFELLNSNGFKVFEFTSDVVNFSKGGKICSSFFARLFPALGKSLIAKCKKQVV